MSQKHILLSCFYFSPFRGSEAGVGWRIANGLAKTHKVTVLCGDFSDSGITAGDMARFRRENGTLAPGLEVHEIRADRMALIFHRLHGLPGMWFLYYLAYERWQRQALALAKKLHDATPFDLAHHVNIIGFREPGYLWKLGIPWFWGPIAGASMIPWSFLPMMSRSEQFRWGSRNLMNHWQMRHSPRCLQAARQASHIWGVTPEDCTMVRNLWKCPVEPMLETGTAPLPAILPKCYSEGSVLKLVWSGLFQGRKALPLLIAALVRLRSRNWELHILGDGPEKSKWQNSAASNGLSPHIHWHGMISRDEALKVMGDSHVFIHTSIKEGTPHVVLEALAMGLPVICHDSCGMGTAVNEQCGLKVPFLNPETSTNGFAMALNSLFENPGLITVLSEGAIRRAKELSWDSIIMNISERYESNL